MLYLFTGDDAANKRSNYETFIQTLPNRLEVFSIARNGFDRLQIESLYSGSSLFSPVSLVVFERILESPETRDFLLEKLQPMAASENHFVFIEDKIGKPILDLFKRAKARITMSDLPKEKK